MESGSAQPALDALYRISSVLNATDDPAEALEIVIEKIIEILPAESAAIELVNPENNRLEIEAYRGFPRSLPETRLKIGQGLTGWVALHGRPLRVGDVTADARYVEVDPAILSEMAVPLMSQQGGVLGVVNVSSRQREAFSDQDLKVLSLLSGEASRVLGRLWLIQQLRRAAEHRDALISIARVIVNQRSSDEILQFIARRALVIDPCRLCAVFLLEPDGETLALQAVSGSSLHRSEEERFTLDQSAIGTALRRRKTIEVLNLARTEEHHFVEVTQREGLVSLLACPIELEEGVIGTLNIYTKRSHRFNNEEKRVFETLAGLAAAAVRNARLYERVFQSEESLRRSERLTTLGLLSSEIAHEIRNPLTVIQLLFDSLSLEFEETDPRRRDVTIIHEKLAQLDSIVSRVLSFGKSREELRADFNLEDLLEDTFHLIRLKLRQARVDLHFHPDREGPLPVRVNKGQIQQAVLNLLLNATQAMPAGGRIDISTTKEKAGERKLAVLRVRDTGAGIDPEVQDRIFDHFLTGRADGTGLGLSIVQRILEAHHGEVSVEETGPGGTTLRVSLPLAQRAE